MPYIFIHLNFIWLSEASPQEKSKLIVYSGYQVKVIMSVCGTYDKRWHKMCIL